MLKIIIENKNIMLSIMEIEFKALLKDKNIFD